MRLKRDKNGSLNATSRSLTVSPCDDGRNKRRSSRAGSGEAPAPVASRRLEGEKLGSPAFGCDARPLGCNRVGGFTSEVPHDLPTDGRVRIEEPFEVRGPGCVIL